VKLQKTSADSPKSWSVDTKSIDQTTFDLSVKNPNGGEIITHAARRRSWRKSPRWMLKARRYWQTSELCYESRMEIQKARRVCQTGSGGTPLKSRKEYYERGAIPWLLSGEVSQAKFERQQTSLLRGIR